jgi:carbon monoxide dehydrogenase subunit G
MAGPVVVEYRGSHQFAATPAKLWDALADFDQLELWGWLQHLRLEGAPLATGSILHGVVVPPVPYRIRLHIEFVECHRPTQIDAAVSGDLAGEAHLRLRRRGSGTEVAAEWTLEMKQLAMRAAGRAIPRTMRWGHDRVVDASANALRNYLLTGSAPR